MADLLLEPLIKIVMQKAADSLMQQVVEMWGTKDQREKLHDKLLAVQDVLADAEHQGASKPAVKNWMLKLKSAAYDAEDVLDELCYEELRRDAVQRGHKVGNTVSILFSPNNPALFGYKMNRKLKKVVERIEELVAEMEKFKFLQGHHTQVVNRVRTDSLVVESKIVGRDDDKEMIVKLLLEGGDNADLTVVPVVGMGGIGKTTLAQLVYNDASIKEHFKLLLWVCVSEEFDMGLLVKSILDLVNKGECNVSIDNMELLQRRLRLVLGGKRYLLVLDDVWNENVVKWERLRAWLNFGDPGSGIIVTTRSSKVASIMGTVENYSLGCLGDEDSWSLFHKRAFSMGVKECKELVDIGQKIVQNCRGLPLAINTLGSLMSYKYEVWEWLAILQESCIWEKITAEDEVLPVLRLSYEHLPLYMKQCFVFCAVFPKDHVMEKEKLIQYWMANGFISSDGKNGNDTFNELAWRSFFQDVKQVFDKRVTPGLMESGNWSRTTCKMHDLIHDLARSMGDECLSMLELPAVQPTQPQITIRHIALRTAPLDINNALNCYPSIRSLILHTEYKSRYVRNTRIVESNALRILNFDFINPIEKIIVTPEKMKHLRYLEISNMNSLPEDISTLYLLQTLRLSFCLNLDKLPDGMQYMSSLRHLYIEHCSKLKSMPSGLGQLSGLQTLTNFIIGTDARNGIGELENLNLHGQLHLYNLCNIRDIVDVTKANLRTKHSLEKLMLCWGPRDYPYSYDLDDFPLSYVTEAMRSQLCKNYAVLNALEPCNKLTVLQIILYGGDKFPVWVTECQVLQNLLELYIIECTECTEIPPVEKLPFLRVLNLKGLDKVRHLCCCASTSIDGGEDAHIAFPSLKKLQLSKMPNLRSWWEGEVGSDTSMVFSQLKKLDIFNCPMLIAMPTVPLLKKLSVKGNTTLSCFATGLTTLQRLKLVNHGRSRETESSSEALAFKPWEFLKELTLEGYNSIVPISANEGDEMSTTVTQCRKLVLISCHFDWSHIPSNAPLWFWKCFTFLQNLWVEKCDNLIYWPEEEFRSLINLTLLSLQDCKNFLGSQLESPVGRSITEVTLPKLVDLWLYRCLNLVEIPKCSTSIKTLGISGCSKLQCLPEWLGSMVTLKELEIRSCESLNSLPLSIGGLTSLEHILINGCPNLADLPEEMEGLKALEKLEIIKCPKIRVLPEGLLGQLKNLDQLWIIGCPHLERHFGKLGKYRHLIFKIRLKKIGGKEIWEY